MTDVLWRIFFYFVACIPLRMSMVYILYAIPTIYLPYLSILFLLMGLGFLYSFIHMLLTPHISHIGLFQGEVWWNINRLLHGIVYIQTFFYLRKKNLERSIPLLVIDLLYGIFTFILYYSYLLFKNTSSM